MRLIVIGPQGAGKGTQSDRIARWFRVPHVETGKILRAAVRDETPLGKHAKEFMERGDLVPDELVVSMLEERLSEPDAANGFLLDGFPRNRAQAEALDRTLAGIGAAIDAVIDLQVPDEELVRRLTDRLTCLVCGRVYNSTNHRPVVMGRCNADGTFLVKREDDKPEAIRRRLEIFHRETAPLITFYEDRGLVTHVDGVGDIVEVQRRIVEALEGRGVAR